MREGGRRKSERSIGKGHVDMCSSEHTMYRFYIHVGRQLRLSFSYLVVVLL